MQLALLLFVIGSGFGLVAWLLNHTLDHEFEHRALAVAQSVAANPLVARDVAAEDQPPVQRLALQVQHATDALFVVVTDDRGIRYAHPNPAEIGKEVSTSPYRPLHGHDVTNIRRGTLGLSARGKVPLRLASGRIVGEVSVGFGIGDISAAFWRLLRESALFAIGALLLGVAGSTLLARILKRGTFGLQPDELADLVREREAVLYSVSEGVIATDATGRITVANGEAARLLERPALAGQRLDRLDLPRRVMDAMSERSRYGRVVVAGQHVLIVRTRTVERGGRKLGSVITLLDHTEVERLTDELHAVRMLTRALRAQRHEFANRLHTVNGLLQTATPADARDYLAALIQAPPLGNQDPNEAAVPAPVRSFLTAKAAEAAESEVSLTLSETSWAPFKLIAPIEVITVLGNLVNNAIEAAAASAHRPAWVEVDILADGATLVVAVADSGDGIVPERVESIFTEQVSTRGAYRGLGLATSRQIAESVGGSVTITNSGVDGPTVFAARLPGVLDPAASRQAEQLESQ